MHRYLEQWQIDTYRYYKDYDLSREELEEEMNKVLGEIEDRERDE